MFPANNQNYYLLLKQVFKQTYCLLGSTDSLQYTQPPRPAIYTRIYKQWIVAPSLKYIHLNTWACSIDKKYTVRKGRKIKDRYRNPALLPKNHQCTHYSTYSTNHQKLPQLEDNILNSTHNTTPKVRKPQFYPQSWTKCLLGICHAHRTLTSPTPQYTLLYTPGGLRCPQINNPVTLLASLHKELLNIPGPTWSQLYKMTHEKVPTLGPKNISLRLSRLYTPHEVLVPQNRCKTTTKKKYNSKTVSTVDSTPLNCPQ